MVKISIKFELKNYRFSNEYIKGLEKPSNSQGKVQIAHFLDKVNFQILNETEIKIKFHFKVIIAPSVGEYNFNGECIMESPEQENIRHLLKNYPAKLKHSVNRFLLKTCYSYAEKLANSENLYFPPIQKILSSYGIKIRY